MFRSTLVTAALALMLAGPSFGHAKLVSSTPGSDAHITDAPKNLSLTFNEEVKLASLTLIRDGKAVSVTVDKSASSAKTVVVPIAALTTGAYEVHWTAISADDGHVTKGSFAFTVASRAPIP